MMRLVSACLLGIRCRYDGLAKSDAKVIGLSKKEILIPICPEEMGGLQTPRIAAEIVDGDGNDVLDGKAKVLRKDGVDVTHNFISGAEAVLKIANDKQITSAILKSKSPSCGCGRIYDGTFSGKLISGDGVLCALLKRNNISVVSEDDI